ncbi:MAG TPA: glucosyl-3-phosphoglycerate synthase [Thermoleophilaceae bacterium]|nr:glucosyl-3-phosphoglycerate synthase [Thermoleophilaceae bacterium]
MPGRRESVTVLVPARNEVATIAPIVRDLVALCSEGLVDQVLVAEHDSTDGTAEAAARLGAEVVRTAGVFPELGPVAGKGDNLWRGLTAARGDIICFVDADSADFGPHFVHRLIEPLREPGVEYVKAFYRRPWRDGGDVKPTGGGRVTTLLARPLLRRFYPELAWLQQPLAGEMAARRALFESVPFAIGYGLEIGLLIDIYRRVGASAIRQADLHTRQNRHQPLEELAPMSDAILESVSARLVEEGRLTGSAARRLERPPLARASAAA